MPTKKKTRGQLLAAIRQLQNLVGEIQGVYQNDRAPDRAQNVHALCTRAFDVAVDALSTDPPQRVSRERKGKPDVEPLDLDEAIDVARKEYNRLSRWRDAWQALAARRAPGRSQARQERIERRAEVCNGKIRAVMLHVDGLFARRTSA